MSIDIAVDTKKSNKSRLYGLDAMRGVCAVSVMLYHYFAYTDVATSWPFGSISVYIFFCLSGFSLEYVYAAQRNRVGFVINFYSARFFRLFPLYFLLVLLFLYRSFPLDAPEINKALLNTSFLFGISNPGYSSITGGGWSIGIEWFMYLVFPIFLFVRTKVINLVFFCFVFAIAFFYTYAAYKTTALPASSLWINFTQPPAFIHYFFVGVLAGRFYNFLETKGLVRVQFSDFTMFVILLVWFSGLYYIWTTFPSKAVLANFGFFAFSALTLGGVTLLSAFYLPQNKFFVWLSEFLGQISYSLYLIHLWVLFYVRPVIEKNVPDSVFAIIFGCSLLSVAIAFLVYKFFEAPIRDRGRILTRSYVAAAHA